MLLLEAPSRKAGAKKERSASVAIAFIENLNGNGKVADIPGTHAHLIAGNESNGRAGKAANGVNNGVCLAPNAVNGNGVPHRKANGSGANAGLETLVESHPSSATANSVVNGSAAMISRPVAQDRELVDRCLARDVGAWTLMYARFHVSLVASVRAFLGQAGRDAHLVEEIAARVWYALVRDDFWLLARFDVRRGCRLSTFLSLIAKAQARLLLRSERRRKSRELAVARNEVEPPQDAGLYSLTGEEFIATLSLAEKRFLVDVLVASTDHDARDRYSSQNLWQLRRRVREKLIKFLE